jgi:3-hydroxyisobutyrate dehydrogenase-like beta-hydroxyacid dehydrogenase
MVGCPVSSYPKALKVLKMMGKETSIFHCGELGAGLTTKFLNNYLSSITALATSETINIAIRAGIDPKKLNDILNVSSGQNFNSSVNCPVPGLTPGNAASRGYTGGFSIELCLGVTQLGLMTAHDVGAKVVLGEAMLQAFTDASQDDRFKGKDSRVIYQWVAHPKEEIA